tara:strand:+ start:851 stop:3271 length:2421 start_codon:yes stop_codon:yes gene_type:complete
VAKKVLGVLPPLINNRGQNVTKITLTGEIGGVDSITAGPGLLGGTITTTGTLQVSVDNSTIRINALGQLIATGGGGAGTVTQIDTGAGLAGGPITTTGTITASVDGTTISTNASGQLQALQTGTVTEINTGSGLDGGPIAGTGTIQVLVDGTTIDFNTAGELTVIDSGGGGGSPAGSNTEIQFNNSGSFGASADLTFDGTELAVGGDIDITGEYHLQGNNALDFSGGNTLRLGVALAFDDIQIGNAVNPPNNVNIYGPITAFDDLTVTNATPLITLKRTNDANVPLLRFQESSGFVGAAIGMDGTSGTNNDLIVNVFPNAFTQEERLRIGLTGTTITGDNTLGDTLLITTTDSTDEPGPIVTLKRNSASPANSDLLGRINFKGENDADAEVTYGQITAKILDESEGTEDGIIEFSTVRAGSSVVNARLRSDSLQLINNTNLVVRGLTYPTADGTSGQAIITDGAGTLSLGNPTISLENLSDVDFVDGGPREGDIIEFNSTSGNFENVSSNVLEVFLNFEEARSFDYIVPYDLTFSGFETNVPMTTSFVDGTFDYDFGNPLSKFDVLTVTTDTAGLISLTGTRGPSVIITEDIVFEVDAGNERSYPGTGTTWIDIVNGNNGSMLNGVTYNSGDGGYMEFDGVDDQVEVGSSAEFEDFPLSIDVWFYADGVASKDDSIITKGISRGSTSQRDWDIFGNGTNLIFVVSNGSSYIVNVSSTYPATGQWHHLVCLWDGTTDANAAKMYLNGELFAQGTATNTNYADTADLFIGGNRATFFFDGRISAVKMYDRVLTAAEVRQNYNAIKDRY